MSEAADKLLDHILYIARHFDRKEIRRVVIMILLELNIPPHYEGFEYLLLAIVLAVEDPLRMLTAGIYAQTALVCGCSEQQAEQAIQRAVRAAWRDREDRFWKMYFPPKASGRYTRPSGMVFIYKLARAVELWSGARQPYEERNCDTEVAAK